MYKIVITKRAIKDLTNIDREMKDRIAKKVREYIQDPFTHAQKLSNPKIGTYRFRIGDYRIIFDIDGDELVILRIGHRKSIYK